MGKLSKEAVLPALLRTAPRLLPVGALFLPLGTLTIKILIEKVTQYNIVTMIQAFTGEDSELFTKLLATEPMAAARTWMYVTAVGLVLSILAMLAGLALAFSGKTKILIAGTVTYGVGTLAGICAGVAFSMCGAALAGAMNNMVGLSVNFGTWVLVAVLLLNFVLCLSQWRRAKERARLAELAKKKRKKK